MILLTVDEVIRIYEMVISTTGGIAEIRDKGLLESAVYSADASFDIVMLMTLELNEIKINHTQSELVNLGLSIADGSMVYQDIYEWIIEHKI